MTGDRLRRRHRTRTRGQALAEFALIAPIFFTILGAIVQFGVIFWGQNTLTQIARETGRWEATQGSCSNSGDVVAEANLIASQSSLIGYESAWPAAGSASAAGVFVSGCITGSSAPSSKCPPQNNGDVCYVIVSIRHTVPVFFPGFEYLPAIGTCDGTGCHVQIQSSAEYRLEPRP